MKGPAIATQICLSTSSVISAADSVGNVIKIEGESAHFQKHGESSFSCRLLQVIFLTRPTPCEYRTCIEVELMSAVTAVSAA